SGTPTRTATVTRTATRSQTATATATGTLPSTATRTGIAPGTGPLPPPATVTATRTLAATATITPTPSPSPTSSPSVTETKTVTPTRSATGTPTFVPPGAPSDLTCRAVLGTLGWVIHLEWADNSTLETEFHIERAVDGAAFSEVATVAANVTTYAEGPVAGDLMLSYRVRAHRHSIDTFSDYSNVATCETRVLTHTPTGTATATASATPTPSATSTMPPPAFCRSTRFGGISCKIDFEHLPDGSRPLPLADVIRDQYELATGVNFPDGGWLVTPRDGTSSPDFAFMSATGSGQEFNLGPLPITFTGVRVKRLALRIGLNQAISGAHPVLTVFDETGTRSMATTGAAFGDGPTRVDQLIEVRPTDFPIEGAE